MKTRLFLIVFCILLAGLSSTFAQGFQPPAEGKAVVYFVRVTSMGFAISFEYFHQDKYIGVAKGKNYIRYECDPGAQLFWVSTENKEFVTADLQAGGTYMVIVDVAMGLAKARVGLNPITDTSDKELFIRAKELINAETAVVTPQEKIDQMNVKLKDFIAEKLKTYEEKWKNEKEFKHISPDMVISGDGLK
jgi:hypothetical protein